MGGQLVEADGLPVAVLAVGQQAVHAVGGALGIEGVPTLFSGEVAGRGARGEAVRVGLGGAGRRCAGGGELARRCRRALRLGHGQAVQSDDAGDLPTGQGLRDKRGSLREVALVSIVCPVSLEGSAERRRNQARRSGRLDREARSDDVGETFTVQPRFYGGDFTVRGTEQLVVLPRSQPLMVER